MICPICEGNNIAATEHFKDGSIGYHVLYTCHDCGYHGPIYDLLEIRKAKINKIKAKL